MFSFVQSFSGFIAAHPPIRSTPRTRYMNPRSYISVVLPPWCWGPHTDHPLASKWVLSRPWGWRYRGKKEPRFSLKQSLLSLGLPALYYSFTFNSPIGLFFLPYDLGYLTATVCSSVKWEQFPRVVRKSNWHIDLYWPIYWSKNYIDVRGCINQSTSSLQISVTYHKKRLIAHSGKCPWRLDSLLPSCG